MAEPIDLKLAPRDPREALYNRLEKAPLEHVEGIRNYLPKIRQLTPNINSADCYG